MKGDACLQPRMAIFLCNGAERQSHPPPWSLDEVLGRGSGR